MNTRPLGLLSLLALGIVAGCAKSPSTGSTTAAAPAATPSTIGATATDAQLFEAYGWFVGSRTGVSELGLSATELDAFLKGVRVAAGGQPSPYNFETLGPKLDELMAKRSADAAARAKAKNTAEGAAYFAKLKDNKSVTMLPSGLGYEILQAGSGPSPKATDTVKVHYEGKFIDGTVFDSSLQRGEPVEFPLNGVIAGWTEGLQKTNKGGKLKLHVPANLAYGDEGRQGMPPASTLIFEVELLEINPPAPAALPALPAAK